jgi:hypothetical protein
VSHLFFKKFPLYIISYVEGVKTLTLSSYCHIHPLLSVLSILLGYFCIMANKYYKRSGYLGIAIAGALLVIYLALGYTPFLSDEFIASEWFLDLLPIPLFVSGIISSTTYIGKTCDLIATKNLKKSPYEKILTPLFLLLGISLGIGLSIVLTIAKTFIVDTIVFTMNCISAIAGLGNRLGTIADNKNDRPVFEKSIMSIAFGFAIVGVVLTLVGATSFFSGGALVPVWLSAFMYISNLVSTSDYSSKAMTQIVPYQWKSEQQKSSVNNKKFEYRGATLGTFIGIATACIIIASIAIVTHGIGLIPALVIFNMSISGLGGFFSRIGRLVDFKNEKHKNAENIDPQKNPPLLENKISTPSILTGLTLPNELPFEKIQTITESSKSDIYDVSTLECEKNITIKSKNTSPMIVKSPSQLGFFSPPKPRTFLQECPDENIESQPILCR